MNIGICDDDDFTSEIMRRNCEKNTDELFVEELLRRYALWKATESTIDSDTCEHFIDWNMRYERLKNE